MGFLDNKSYFDGDKPLIIPHRGGSNIVPENTLHGLELAIKEGFSHFETDLRMSKMVKYFFIMMKLSTERRMYPEKSRTLIGVKFQKLMLGISFMKKVNKKIKQLILLG